MKTLQQLREAFFEAFAAYSSISLNSAWQWFEPHLSTPGTTEGEVSELIAKFFSGYRIYDDPDIDYLCELDAISNKVYAEHCIKDGFHKAQLLSYEAVVEAILTKLTKTQE